MYHIDNNKVVLREWFSVVNIEIKPLIVSIRIGIIFQKEMILIGADFMVHTVKISTLES